LVKILKGSIFQKKHENIFIPIFPISPFLEIFWKNISAKVLTFVFG